MSGELGGFGDDLVDAHDDGGAAQDSGAAAVGVAAIMGDVGVAAEDDDIGHGDAESVGGDLGEAGFLALAVRGGAGDNGDFAGHFNADAAPFPTTGGHGFGGGQGADF